MPSDNRYELVAAHDGVDAVWFFADLYEDILRQLKGRAVFAFHGLGFKPYLNPTRVDLLTNHVDQIWSTGQPEEVDLLRAGVPRAKLLQVGYTIPFLVPRRPTTPGRVFVSVGWFDETVPWAAMKGFMAQVPHELEIVYGLHPSMPEDVKREFTQPGALPSNCSYLSSDEEVFEAYDTCERAVGGFSSVLTVFHYLRKPVVLAVGSRWGSTAGSARAVWRTRNMLFARLVLESSRLSLPDSSAWDRVRAARVASSAVRMFYPWNWDRAEVAGRMRAAIARLHPG